MSEYFTLFACCKPVKGASVSILCDLQRGNYIHIPDGLFEILTSQLGNPVSQIIFNYGVENAAVIREYFQFLIKEEYGFMTTNAQKEEFPSISTKFETPERINNAIVDCDESSQHNWGKIFSDLEVLGCKFVELRFFNSPSVSELHQILSGITRRRFHHISIYVKYSLEFDLKTCFSLCERYPNVGRVIVHTTPNDRLALSESSDIVQFILQEISDEDCCGNISRSYFSVCLEHFNEALSYNTCLNKKISITKSGAIKNCPSLPADFGNIESKSLLEVAADQSFQYYWGINKDQINVCRDCQFRYICIDCRAFLENKFDKPKKCNYDPYKNIWQ